MSPTADPSDLKFAHILFMDIVGFTAGDDSDPDRQLAQQVSIVQELQELVSQQPEFRRASSSDELLCIPTGDGMALVFFQDPLAPLQCAVQLSRALRDRPHLQLRMGIHSGPVYRVADINANANVQGGGINLAQRVMDCGEAGHILVSDAVKALVGQVGAWPMEDIGVYEVKHGKSVQLYNVHSREFGNPSPPRRKQLRGGVAGQKVVLLYRRGADPDEGLLQLLAAHLAGAGAEVFWDRQIKVGMKWAEEIERQIRGADAVIPLLSEQSMHSEMLACELQMARETAESRQGKPRILPIRVRYTGALPEGVAVVLDQIEYALWESPADDQRLLDEILAGLAAPAPEARTAPPRSTLAPAAPVEAPAAPSSAPAAGPVELEAVGGAVPLGSRFYVERPSDAAFLTAISRRDSIVLVNGARQMGKTSLLARGLQQARESGARVALTDFQWLNAEQLDSADALFRALGEAIADQLDLDVYPDEVWNARSGASVNFQRYMRRAALGPDRPPLVWGLDEVDRLFTCPFGSEVFGLFRSWHNARALDPTGPWSLLTLAIGYATEAHLFITDVNQSPFNVGTRVSLADFTPEEVADLNARYGRPLAAEADLDRFYRLLHGHPYLCRRALNEMATRRLSVAQLEAEAPSSDGPFGDHLRRFLVLLARDPELCDVLRGVLRGQPCPTPESFYRLRSAGLIAGESARDARMRCQLYATYLERNLL